MKTIFVKCALCCVLLASASQAQAQFSWGGLLKNVVGGNTDNQTTTTKTNTDSSSTSSSLTSIIGSATDGIGGLISSVTNIFSDDKVATADKIIGTWSYVEPAVVLSSDDVLSNIGGKLAAATVEQKLKTKMESYGLTAGSVKMTFDKQGNFTQTLKGRTLKGTYTVEDKNIMLKYSGVYSQIIGTTQLDGDNLLIVMDASKLLTYVNTLGKLTTNSTLKTASSLLSNMKGLECGLKLVKQ